MDILNAMTHEEMEQSILSFYRCAGARGKAAILKILARHHPDHDAVAVLHERAAMWRMDAEEVEQ